ncbi:hypothetical protein [Nocardioides stalactiti]|uniref:hypothetical protein n=1 Tax=Nocardioides stalactiti TaxID=2755356 RepID=UPI0015FED7FE|nr:hypothetical protein [Nocardioides stalactiti]
MDGVRARTRALVLTVMGAVVGAGLAAAPSQAAEGDPVVTWPTATRVNPTTTSYPLTITYAGSEFLFLTLASGPVFATQVLPSNGTVDVQFSDFDGLHNLTVVVCPTASYDAVACRSVGSTHRVQVYDELVASFVTRLDERGPNAVFPITIRPETRPVDVTWEVVPAAEPGSSPVATGSESVVPGDVLPALGANEEMSHGERYLYRVTMSGDSGEFGLLSGVGEMAFTWDGVVETSGLQFDVSDAFLNKAVRDVEVFYPVEDRYADGWRDTVFFRDTVPYEEFATWETSIAAADGTLVIDDAGGEWDGRDPSTGRVLPEGAYTVSRRATDKYGNVGSDERDIWISHDQLVRTTWTAKVSPKESLIDKYVGRCGAIKVPARRAWRGSIGLRSSTAGPRCRTLESQSVTAVHGIYLPKSPLGRYDRYDNLRVGVYGGGAGRGSNYLVQWLWSRDKKWVGRSQFGRNLTLHQGQRMGAGSVLGDEDKESPYVIWSSGLAEGSQYDIKYYSVSVRYWAIQ